jgi:CheY-like chemotaxis protein
VSPKQASDVTLLVVENDPRKLQDWIGAARRAGCAEGEIVAVASDGEARAVFRERNVDLLVTDLFLTPESEASEDPESSEGLQLIREFKALNPTGKAVAITIRGGMGEALAVIALGEAGADDFISRNWDVSASLLLEYKLRIFLGLLRREPRSLV